MALKENLAVLVDRFGDDKDENIALAKEFFRNNTENLADDVPDLVHLCEMPYAHRLAVTYPVIGNYLLIQMAKLEPQNETQAKQLAKFATIIKGCRFYNHHTHGSDQQFIDTKNTVDKHFSEFLQQSPDDAVTVMAMMKKIQDDIWDQIPKDRWHADNYSTDAGHGVGDPAFTLVCQTYLDCRDDLLKREDRHEYDRLLLVVDDQAPEQWYFPLINAGFGFDGSHEGMARDPTNAQNALERASEHGDSWYKYALIDLQLGDGVMDGEQLIRWIKQYEAETGKTQPRPFLFSFDSEALHAAEQRLEADFGPDTVVCFEKRSFEPQTLLAYVQERD